MYNKENVEEEVEGIYFDESIIQNYVITSPANHQLLFLIVLLASFKNDAC